jgi:hypothetical protein
MTMPTYNKKNIEISPLVLNHGQFEDAEEDNGMLTDAAVVLEEDIDTPSEGSSWNNNNYSRPSWGGWTPKAPMANRAVSGTWVLTSLSPLKPTYLENKFEEEEEMEENDRMTLAEREEFYNTLQEEMNDEAINYIAGMLSGCPVADFDLRWANWKLDYMVTREPGCPEAERFKSEYMIDSDVISCGSEETMDAMISEAATRLMELSSIPETD